MERQWQSYQLARFVRFACAIAPSFVRGCWCALSLRLCPSFLPRVNLWLDRSCPCSCLLSFRTCHLSLFTLSFLFRIPNDARTFPFHTAGEHNVIEGATVRQSNARATEKAPLIPARPSETLVRDRITRPTQPSPQLPCRPSLFTKTAKTFTSSQPPLPYD